MEFSSIFFLSQIKISLSSVAYLAFYNALKREIPAVSLHTRSCAQLYK